jgi:hypothetical protein
MAKKRKPRILILGLPYFGRMLEGLLVKRRWEASFAEHPGRDILGWARLVPKVLRADVIYFIGSRIERNSPQDLLMRVRRKPVVIHWVGTDVQIALDEAKTGRVSRRIVDRAIHWADAPWLVDELATIGVTSDEVALPVPGLPSGTPPLPERFRVLLYCPVDAFDREVFDLDTLLRLPLEFPEISFVLIPSPAETLPGPLPPNLDCRGWVEDIDTLYKDISLYVRLTSHDGVSFMVLECLARGRQVIWPFALPGVIQVSGFEAVAAVVRDLAAKHAAGTLGPNHVGREYVMAHYDAERLTRELSARLRDELSR